MKIKLLIIFLVVFRIGNAQSFLPDVIGSAGTFATSASGSMSWTIGEVITETYAAPGYFLTQGFHQPDTNAVVAITNISAENISIYPNPVIDHLIIDFTGAPGSHTIYMYDMQGQLLKKENISENKQQLAISFHEFANGIYLLNIVNPESNTSNSYKINKSE